LKKREYRTLWIARINAGARLNGTTYSELIAGLDKKQVVINRKVLADLAANHPSAFAEIVKFAVA
jgi:large subunit ribosomal protein L20